MTNEERNKIILDEINLSIRRLLQNPFFSGTGSHSDIFKLMDGRKAQIKIEVTVDPDEFEEPSHVFRKKH
ncbi:hypothetical protein [Allomuricauda sp. ARW1Y1]|jgi:hypothetical protein|uniref:hypothetical protein n=1 Tax=Allomuricauda sp. ARW1Y1 TaxID=2663843 RepID=UPI0015C9EC8E|nr:hypothetical protein [Muricauda sp. ARW1Y1]NYJ27534.1 hypothetical protein [Muricauda sp. ARW1Y1]